MSKSLEESVYEKLYQIFQAVGVGLSIPQMDALRDRSRELAAILIKDSTSKAILFLETIKTELLKAVGELEVRVDKLEKNTDNLKEEKSSLKIEKDEQSGQKNISEIRS